jgi:hydroxymethylbilane synthase
MRLGTRGSALARAQAEWTVTRLREAHPGLKAELVIVKTSGDQKPDVALSAAGGVGLFTKELEDALLKNEIDAAVHSLKDLPTRLSPGLTLAAISKREDYRDAWLSSKDFKALPAGALIGTGSPRRRAQLQQLRPDLKFTEFRGNVDTRLKKLASGEVVGAVLALAGLKRLGLESHARSLFTQDEMLPAPGQGFLGFECRSGDSGGLALLKALVDPEAEACAVAERSFLDRLGAGCQAPVAALALGENSNLALKGFTQNKDGRVFRGVVQGTLEQAAGLGAKLAEILIKQGAELTK